ncbi:MAG TPA: DUF1540 domain-containing protein [Bacilli bacterium]|nr:DUF1540 domain-containing protein [Bacilli bacterium]
MTRVICHVDTCTHYLPGDACGAQNIDIMHEEEGHMARIEDQTMCKTFHEVSGVTSYLGSADNVNWVGSALELLLPGHQADPSISCTVASCDYWAEGRRCVAPAIEVTGASANECQDTNCQTFKPRQ